MSSKAPARQAVTDALVAMLADVTECPAWDPDGPHPASSDYDSMPYSVVECVGGGVSLGDLGSPDGMVAVLWQVTSVGSTRAQALGLADRVREAIIARDTGGEFPNAISAHGVRVTERRWEGDGGVQVDGDVVNVVEDFRLTLVDDPAYDGADPGADHTLMIDGGTP